MKLRCSICPRHCDLEPGKTGNCRVRANINGKITLLTYGKPCAVHIDPVEKKPMFHFYPGSKAFSIATAGCNLHCKNCQNWQISQANPDQVPAYDLPPEKLVSAAIENKCESIAYTYTDPVVFYEYTYDASIIAKEKGIKNILVTAGYINKEPFKKLCEVTDGANIDLKAFSDKFYKEVSNASLKPVLETLVYSKNAGVATEVTNLIIPTLNDSDNDLQNLCKWIKSDMGADTPLHFSRFHPDYMMRNLPPTSSDTLKKAYDIARAEGLLFVYIGNIAVENTSNTYCPSCGKLLVERAGYHIRQNHVHNGTCSFCSYKIYGRWN